MSSLSGTLAAVQTCWQQTAAHLGRSSDRASPSTVAEAAARSVEDAVFLVACRARGLLPNGPPAQLRQRAIDRFGPALFQLRPEDQAEAASSDCPLSGAACGPLGSLEDRRVTSDGACPTPDFLGPLHHRLLGLHSSPGPTGRTRTDRSKTAAKDGSVFYTPPYVTRYMVTRAVESLRQGDPNNGDAEPPRLIDPACGCGVFLLAAYRYLRACTARHNSPCTRRWPRRRRRILQRLHGVDLDPGAVLAARRALWLEAADEPAGPLETDETGVFFETIRQGNALVGPALDPLAGAFDLVLANPPYRRERGAKTLLDQIAQTPFGHRWRTPRMDLWYYFAHRAVELLRNDGLMSLIVSRYWTAGSGAAKLVEQLRREMHVEEIVDLDRLRVFDRVAGRHMILRARKTRRARAVTVVKRPKRQEVASAEPFLAGRAPRVVFKKTADELFRDGRIDLEPVAHDLLAAIARGTPLGRLGRVRQGIAENPATVTRQTISLLQAVQKCSSSAPGQGATGVSPVLPARHGHDARGTPRCTSRREILTKTGHGVFVLTPDEFDALDLPDEEKSLLRPYHQPRDVGRYRLAERASRTLIYSTPQTCPDVRAFPAVRRHLARFRPIMEARRETRQGRRPWWQLHWPRDPSLWTADKILSVQMAPRPAFAAALGPVYVNFSVNVFVPDRSTREHLLYLLALLNSRPLEKWFRHHAKRRGVGLEINGRVLAQAPIRRIDFARPSERQMHDELVELAAEASRVRACTHGCHDDDVSDEIEHRIDTLVARLYGLQPLGGTP